MPDCSVSLTRSEAHKQTRRSKRIRLGRRAASLVLALCLVAAPATGVHAAVTEEARAAVADAVTAYVAPYVGQNALTNYGGKATLCHAFVNYVWKNVFGCDLYQGAHTTTPPASDFSSAALSAYIKQYARPGDILRVDQNTHSLVILSFDEASVTGYDWLNSSARPPYIGKRTYTWEQIAKWRSWSTASGETYFLCQVRDDLYNKLLPRSTPVTAQPAAEPAVPEVSLAVESLPAEPEATSIVPISRGSETRSNIMILQIDNPVMTINGLRTPIDGQGTKPIIAQGRTLLPLRAVVQAMGGSLTWDPIAQSITIARSPTKIELTINQLTALIDGQATTLDSAPILLKGRTLLPIRPIAEALGAEVAWNAKDRAVTITY